MLTEYEIATIGQELAAANNVSDIDFARAIEVAVLAKLREQQAPVAVLIDEGFRQIQWFNKPPTGTKLFTHPAPIPEGWISVDDRLPETDEEVLVFPPPSDYCITASYGHVAKAGHQKAWEWGEYETGYGHVNHKYQPTHWMPLPKPPTAAARSVE